MLFEEQIFFVCINLNITWCEFFESFKCERNEDEAFFT